MRIVTLIENISSNNLLFEHGLSLYIEYEGRKILIDTGASDKFISNAKDLGIDLSAVEYVIITHNHYDHIGGLKSFLKINKQAKVYIRANAFPSQFYRKGKGSDDIKKLSYDWQEFNDYQERFCLLDEEYRLIDGVNLLFVDNPDERYMSKDIELTEYINGDYVKDKFRHELFATFKYNNSTIIVSSCSHNGAINIIEEAKTKLMRPVSYFIGGLHMKGRSGLQSLNCSVAYVKQNSEYLRNNVGNKVYTGHCTGLKAYEIIQETLKDKLEYLNTGGQIEL